MTTSRSCDICHASYRMEARNGAIAVTKVDRYQLRKFIKDRSPQYISAGGIDLCERCWEDIGKPRMRPDRRPRHCRIVEEDGA